MIVDEKRRALLVAHAETLGRQKGVRHYQNEHHLLHYEPLIAVLGKTRHERPSLSNVSIVVSDLLDTTQIHTLLFANHAVAELVAAWCDAWRFLPQNSQKRWFDIWLRWASIWCRAYRHAFYTAYMRCVDDEDRLEEC